MSDDSPKGRLLSEEIPVYVFGFLVVGLLMGGIYSLPAMRITKSTDPWYTILLGVGLTITVTAMGLLIFTSTSHILYGVLIANALLVIRRLFGKLDHNVERFGLIHALCLTACFWYLLLLGK